MELGNILTVENYNDFRQRLFDFANTLQDAGYETPDLTWTELVSELSDVYSLYSPSLFRESIANMLEQILEYADDNTDWVNPYSQKGFVFVKKNGALHPYVKRWFDWLEYNEKIVSGEIQKHQYLFSVESDVEEQVFDINGEPIMTIEGYFGQTITN